METLKTFNIAKSNNDWLQDSFITPLKKVRASLKGYGHQYDEASGTGIHTLIFDLGAGPTNQDIKFIQSLMYQDDGQPTTTYTYYFGTLWVHIPYVE
jgi:hypothetical protein